MIRCAALLAVLALAPPMAPLVPREVTSITLTELTVQSELIVVAKVNKLITRSDGTFASATPIEYWKGASEGDVEYIVSSTFECDISAAIPGERAVLFLSKDSSGRLKIAHYGRGRLPLVKIGEKDIAKYWGGVMMPESAPVTVVDKSNGPYSKGVELNELKRLVAATLSNTAWSSVDSWYRPPRSIDGFVPIAPGKVQPVVESLQDEAQQQLETVAARGVSAAEAERLVGRPLPAGVQCVLLRGVVLNEANGAFEVSASDQVVLVHHGCLGHQPVPMKRKAIVAVLSAVPRDVYVTCDMAE